MTLIRSHTRIVGRLSRRRNQATSIFEGHVNGLHTPWKFRFLAEALLSNLWIDWNIFVKQVLVLSCNGSTTRSGVLIPARATLLDNGESRITYEVKQLSSGSKIDSTKTFSGPIEPTWAHPDKIIACITGLAPSNTPALQMAFGSAGLFGPKRIHLVRNACAHKSKLNRNDVRGLRSLYLTSHFLDPIDIIWGSNPLTNSIAIFEWIEDLEIIADLATQ